jgi:hypothetical protein
VLHRPPPRADGARFHRYFIYFYIIIYIYIYREYTYMEPVPQALPPSARVPQAPPPFPHLSLSLLPAGTGDPGAGR